MSTRETSRWTDDEGPEPIVLAMVDVIPGRRYICELIQIDDAVPIKGLRTTHLAPRENKDYCRDCRKEK